MTAHSSSYYTWGPFVLRSWWHMNGKRTAVRIIKDRWWEHEGPTWCGYTLWLGFGKHAIAASYCRRTK